MYFRLVKLEKQCAQPYCFTCKLEEEIVKKVLVLLPSQYPICVMDESRVGRKQRWTKTGWKKTGWTKKNWTKSESTNIYRESTSPVLEQANFK